MDDKEMNDMLKKAQEMIQNNQVPDDLKSIVSMMQNNNNNNNNNNNSSNNVNANSTNSANNNPLSQNGFGSDLFSKINMNNSNSNVSSSNAGSDIDIETLMRLQKVMSKMKSADSNDDMGKLLMSLKPYLRDDKKGKIDEYMQLLKVGKLTQLFESFGGDKK